MTANRTILDADKRLSESIIWQIQRAYFEKAGIDAWREGVVPHQISCNPFMARTYAQLASAFLHDCLQDGGLDESTPIHIVELGAGSGRLLYHFMHWFRPIIEHPPFAHLTFKFILTDFAPATVTFWQQHPYFEDHVQAGRLSFALFDAENPRRPDTIHPNGNPLIVLANYFFDSIPQDSFVVDGGLLCENLLTVTSTQPEPDLCNPAIWQRLSLDFEAIPTSLEPYDDAIFNDIVDFYATEFPDTHFSFPSVGLNTLRFWQQVGDDRLLVLSSDRGVTLPDAVVGQPAPTPNLHGSFSLMVNYHAIGEFVQRAGGQFWASPHYQDNLQTVAVTFGAGDGAALAQAFAATVVQHGPDDFYNLKKVIEPTYDTLTLPQLLSFLRLSAYDADIFRDSFPTMLQHIQSVDGAWFPDIYAAIVEVVQLYLPLSDDDDLFDLVDVLIEEIGYDEI